MENKNILVVGGSSGIGLELVRLLNSQQHNLYTGSRSKGGLEQMTHVQHLPLDVTVDSIELETLPEVIHGLAYCP